MPSLELIQARMKKLQQQAEAMIAKQAQSALDQIRQLMLKHGLTTRDIEARAKARREVADTVSKPVSKAKPKASGQVKGKLPPKYRDPKSGATWSGKARPPSWIAGAKDRTKFLIDSASAPIPASKPAGKKAAAKKATARTVVARKATAAKPATKVASKKAAAKKSNGAKKPVSAKTITRGKAGVAVKPGTPSKKRVARKVSAKSAASPTPTPAGNTPVEMGAAA